MSRISAVRSITLTLRLSSSWRSGPGASSPSQMTGSAQAEQQVGQLGQLDLGLALPGAGVLGEDAQGQRGPVDHLGLDLVLQLAQLAGRERAVADDGVGAGGVHGLAQLVDLSGANVCG